ncbi:MAG: response regulator [Chlorobiaceae bacterium]|jgi:DNA-binding response OmpR family regulator|nr:response regulator [Chlorobiaceae bacterium]
MNILVVEDDAAVRRFICTILKRENYTVYEADNGINALLLLKEQKDISLMITDLIMPEKEGIETIVEVKKHYPSIKIIAISGGGQVGPENFLILADALGAHTTLKKPFSSQELIRAVKNL